MKYLSDFHAHTTYVDGADSAEEMVKAAIAKGLTAFGLSEHAHDSKIAYGMSAEAAAAYRAEMSALKAKYKETIDLLCGIEQDYFSPHPTDGYDYVIGATHCFMHNGDAIVVDASERIFTDAVNYRFGGDAYALAEEYYRVHGEIARVTKCDIVAHFDIVNKFNAGDKLFDTSHPRYRAAAIGAMTEILKDCNVFELNTGAMYRVGHTEPYPQFRLLKELRERGGEVILSSDAHNADAICYRFADMEELLREAGFRYRKSLTRGGFIDIKI